MGKRRKLTKLIAMLMLTVFAVFIVSRNGSNAAPEGTGVSTLNALTSAINSASTNGEEVSIYLTADITFSKKTTLKIDGGKNIKLDLNGHSLILGGTDLQTSAVKNSAAKTGDDTPVALLIALSGVSVAAIVVCVILKIKKGKKKDSPGDESEE